MAGLGVELLGVGDAVVVDGLGVELLGVGDAVVGVGVGAGVFTGAVMPMLNIVNDSPVLLAVSCPPALSQVMIGVVTLPLMYNAILVSVSFI